MKFVYPSETKHLTRDWILMKADKGWRSYKSRLKGRYFNPDVRTLNDILKYVPKGVNGYQWRGLVKIWCQDKHKVTSILMLNIQSKFCFLIICI